jgi:hypothetical protein
VCGAALLNGITEGKGVAGGSERASSSSGVCVLRVQSRVFRDELLRRARGWALLTCTIKV